MISEYQLIIHFYQLSPSDSDPEKYRPASTESFYAHESGARKVQQKIIQAIKGRLPTEELTALKKKWLPDQRCEFTNVYLFHVLSQELY